MDSPAPDSSATARARIAAFLRRPAVENAVLGVILFNAVLLGMETSPSLMDAAGPLILALDRACLAFFIVEIAARLFAFRRAYLLSGWGVFDIVIVGIALIPGGGQMSVLRALRVLRVLRVISVSPSLRRVVQGFVSALPGMGSVFLLMSIIFYIGAVMATKLFGMGCPTCTPEQAAQLTDWFGTLGRSAYSLFQIMTLESWSMGIVRPVMAIYPWAWAFFVPFIMVTTFAVVNLLVGLIVNSMQDAHHAEDAAATDAWRDEVLARLAAIDQRLESRRDGDGPG
jgi:voltage-gated sodium channel